MSRLLGCFLVELQGLSFVSKSFLESMSLNNFILYFWCRLKYWRSRCLDHRCMGIWTFSCCCHSNVDVNWDYVHGVGIYWALHEKDVFEFTFHLFCDRRSSAGNVFTRTVEMCIVLICAVARASHVPVACAFDVVNWPWRFGGCCRKWLFLQPREKVKVVWNSFLLRIIVFLARSCSKSSVLEIFLSSADVQNGGGCRTKVSAPCCSKFRK